MPLIHVCPAAAHLIASQQQPASHFLPFSPILSSLSSFVFSGSGSAFAPLIFFRAHPVFAINTLHFDPEAATQSVCFPSRSGSHACFASIRALLLVTFELPNTKSYTNATTALPILAVAIIAWATTLLRPSTRRFAFVFAFPA